VAGSSTTSRQASFWFPAAETPGAGAASQVCREGMEGSHPRPDIPVRPTDVSTRFHKDTLDFAIETPKAEKMS